ncbi:MAG: PDZ domain-containing protein [Planctomycetota bacterium]|nr:PDZ domain-containing protein [Planctomycetota bacterium]
MVADALPAADEPLADTPPPEALPTETSPEPTRESAKKPAAGSSLADLIAAADTLPLPKGDGVITGVVRTQAGEPLAGVTITATPSYPEERNWSGLDTEARIREQIRYEKWRELARRNVVTGADGNYRLEGLALKTDYSVWAELEGWRFERTPHRNYFQAGMEANFKALVNIMVPLEVRLPDGRAPRQAEVKFHKAGEENSVFATRPRNGTGVIGLEPGDWVASAKAGDAWEYESELVTFKLAAGQAPPALVFELKGRSGLQGKVSVPAGYRFESLEVVVLPGEGVEPPPLLTASMLESKVAEVVVWPREAWSFQVLDLAPATYRVVLHYGNRVLDWRNVTVGGDLAACDLAVPPARAEDYFAVRVYDPEGEATDAVQVYLAVTSDQHGYSGWSEQYRPEPDTRLIWIRRVTLEELIGEHAEQWMYTITVRSKKYGQLSQPYAPTDRHELVFRFQHPAHVTVTVPGYNEHDLRERLTWSVVEVGKEGRLFRRWERERLGTSWNVAPLKFGPLVPGRYELVLMFEMKHSKRELLRRPIDLAGGENAVSAEVPSLYTLTVRCRTKAEAEGVSLYRGTSRYATWEDEVVREGAVARFLELPEGEYRLETGAGTLALELSADKEVDFAPRVYDCLVISGIKPGGLIEGLGLCNGDKLIAVDGNPCEDLKLFRAHLDVSKGKDSTTWTVLRNGVPIDVTFSGKQLTEILKNRSENSEDIDLDRAYRDD